MALTTPSQVRLLLGPEFDTGIDLTGCIDLAHVLVDRWCPGYDATAQPDGYTADQREMIERALAAHVVMASPNARAGGADNPVREKAGEVEEEYNRRLLHTLGLGFDGTDFGQLAMRLDWRGSLAALNTKMKTVSMQVPAGKKPLIAGKAIGGGPDQRRPYRPNDARWF